MTAVERFPTLSPLVMAKLPFHEEEYVTARSIHEKIGIGGTEQIRHCLKGLEDDGDVESKIIPWRNLIVRVYRRTARAKENA